ncbi:uncharacterized protein [Periplaneta americana]|uniref:uncharacterized protein n=1 Tax=Periplaneta americana TaxID=6978 RepID=UPI0037E876FF
MAAKVRTFVRNMYKLAWLFVFLRVTNSLIPVDNIEKGFIPSPAWFEETSNKSMAEEETKQQEMKKKLFPPFLNHHYNQHPNPSMPVPNQLWAPSVPSTPPPPPPNYSVVVNIQIPEAFVLVCQVEEPLEHISWLWYPCPNHQSPGEGMLIADGTIVSNTSLYGVRILGQNGIYVSELHILQNPLLPGIAGLYRCEAWPHGATKDSSAQSSNTLYHDEFIIGGQLMVKTCFYDGSREKYYYQNYGMSTYGRNLRENDRQPRNSTESDISSNMIRLSTK